MVDVAQRIPVPVDGVDSAAALVTAIERSIGLGHLQPGDRLASVRSEAERLDLAPNTVAAAYRRLRDRGVVVGKGRQGTIVADRPQVRIASTSPLPPGVIDAMSGNPDPTLLPSLDDALAAAMSRPPNRYGDALVDEHLANAARRMFAADAVDPSACTVVSGAMDALERVLTARLRSGDRVGVEDPGYSSVHQLVTGLGFEPVPVRVDARGLRPDELETALASGLHALVVTPRSHNPTGAAIDAERAVELSALLDTRPEVLVIEDDHAGPVAGVDLAGLGRDRPHWAVVRSAAKSLGPDLRVACLAGDADTVGRVEARLQIGPGWVSHILQRTVAHLLDDPVAAAAVDRAAATYTARRTRMLDLLGDAGIAATGPSGLHVWVPVAQESPVVSAMRDRGVAVRAGAGYRIGSPPAVRLTIAGLDDAQLDTVANALVDVLSGGVATSPMA